MVNFMMQVSSKSVSRPKTPCLFWYTLSAFHIHFFNVLNICMKKLLFLPSNITKKNFKLDPQKTQLFSTKLRPIIIQKAENEFLSVLPSPSHRLLGPYSSIVFHRQYGIENHSNNNRKISKFCLKNTELAIFCTSKKNK